MNCTNCGAAVPGGMVICPACGHDVAPNKERAPAYAQQEPLEHHAEEERIRPVPVALSAISRLLLILFSICFFGFVIYTAYFWFDSWRTNRIYESGTLRAPMVEPIPLPFGQKGHSLTFFGKDGDELYIPTLNRSYPFVGGMTQIDIPDSSWFATVPESEDGVIVPLYPVIHTEKNGRIVLPKLELRVDTPLSPLELIDPPIDRIDVDVSIFTLRIKVVPGSTVMINGENQTDFVDHEGLLVSNINVRPHGDNPVSISVATPNHSEIRRDLVLFRAPQTIYLERSLNLRNTTNSRTFKIEGNTAPGAYIEVDTDYVEDSIMVDATGKFEFKAIMSTIGDNVVRWHATQEGFENQYASYTVYYVPPQDVYTGRAWRLNNEDYAELKYMIEMRMGQPYLVRGPIVDMFKDEEDGTNYIVIDITRAGSTDTHYCVLVNRSTVTSPELGRRYEAYADVSGTYFYRDDNVPMFVCRYLLDPK